MHPEKVPPPPNLAELPVDWRRTTVTWHKKGSQGQALGNLRSLMLQVLSPSLKHLLRCSSRNPLGYDLPSAQWASLQPCPSLCLCAGVCLLAVWPIPCPSPLQTTFLGSPAVALSSPWFQLPSDRPSLSGPSCVWELLWRSGSYPPVTTLPLLFFPPVSKVVVVSCYCSSLADFIGPYLAFRASKDFHN